jgi:hypothetical protein
LFWRGCSALVGRFKISPHDDLRGEAGGDWDIERRYPLATR